MALRYPAVGGGSISGAPNGIFYANPAGNGAVNDALLTAAPVDQFGRPQIRDIRVGGAGCVFRQGAWISDGDPTNVVSDGYVCYGQSVNGIQNQGEGCYARIKPSRFGIGQILPGVNGGNLWYPWRVDFTGESFRRDSDAKVTAQIDRLTGDIKSNYGSVQWATFALGPKVFITPEGGYAIQLVNNSGAILNPGEIVRADPANDDSVILAEIASELPLGICYTTTPKLAPAWIVVAGMADVLIDNPGGCGRNYWVGVSGNVAGQGTAVNASPGNVPLHFREIGHTIRQIGGAGLVRCVLHFN